MTNPEFHPSDYKARQRQDWDNVSAGWEKWWSTLEVGAEHISRRLLDLANVEPGHRILDVATGVGEPALAAARRVGPSGHVVAVDQAAGMLDIARRRAQLAELDNVSFQVADGESLAPGEAVFDALLCRWGLMFFPGVDAALERMRRLLRPGGRLAAAVWSTPQRAPSISLAMSVVREQLQLPPPPAGLPGPFALADTAALTRSFERAGFHDVRFESVPVTFSLPSAEAYTEFTRDVAAPIIALVAEQPPVRQAEVWAAVTVAAQRFAEPDGSIGMTNEAICITGQV